MKGRLDDLYGRIIANVDRLVDRKRQLRQTESAVVRVDTRSDELKVWDEWVGHVERFVAEAQVDVDVCCRMVGEPAWLEGDGTAIYGPIGAVGCGAHATA